MITLATLPQATAQQVFDQVKKHLLTQNKRSLNGHDCFYRSGKFKCAAGCLISDNEYKLTMEDLKWSAMIDLNRVPPNHAELIEDLQNLHDDREPSDWPIKLRELAEKFNLQY